MRHQRALFLALFAAATVQAAPAAPLFQPISNEKLSQVQGDYELSNGHRVTLTESSGRLYAVLGKHDRHELLATGENTFSTRDRALSLRFQPDSKGDMIVLGSTERAPDLERSLARVFEEAQRNKQAGLSISARR